MQVEGFDGVRVTPADQPELWALVRDVAHRVGVPAPSAITIIADVDAGVRDRVVSIGAPLLAWLTENQLKAVLAHELALTKRRYFRRYAPLDADEVAARVAGSAAASSALREAPVIGAAWELFVDKHLTAAWDEGYLPSTFFDGFAQLRAAPELRVRLDEIRRSSGPLCDRIAFIRVLDVPGSLGPPATFLLRGDVLDEAVLRSMVDEAGAKTRVDWVTFGHISARTAVVRGTARLLLKAGGTLGKVLDALDEGLVAELGPPDAVPGSASAGPRARRESARPFVCHDVAALVALALSDAGLATWTLSWSGASALNTHLSYEDAVCTAVDGSTSELRATLAAAGVALDYCPA